MLDVQSSKQWIKKKDAQRARAQHPTDGNGAAGAMAAAGAIGLIEDCADGELTAVMLAIDEPKGTAGSNWGQTAAAAGPAGDVPTSADETMARWHELG